MQTGDGLLARIRVRDRTLSPAQLAGLARLAVAHGNGILEISARGNLQARGLRAETAPLFAQAVARLVPLESGLVVDTSPLAGDDPNELSDPRRLAARIRAGAMVLQDKLGPKVCVIVDGFGQISLSALKADIRLLALDATHWAVYLGGGKPQVMDADGAVAATLAVLAALAALGPEARAADLFAASHPATPHPIKEYAILRLREGHANPIALPFGQMHGDALVALAEAAQACGLGTLRLAPGHRLLVDNAPMSLIATAASLGFITDQADPRLRSSACIGNEGCASGQIAARDIAKTLAPLMRADQHLHVSGCAKGCAHPRPSAITLVGRPDGIGLVINGGAGDTPEQVLDEAGLTAALARRENR